MMPLLGKYLDRATEDEHIEGLMAASFRSFHAKGLDYICLYRSPDFTLKAYFLDGDVTKVPEVVNPHDHRYHFTTTVLAGRMMDHRFAPVSDTARFDDEEVYQAFDYRTPLNGGDGFTYRGEETLARAETHTLGVGEHLHSPASMLHTIQMLQDQTVLMLQQFEDVVPLDAPTSCWVRKGYPAPDTSGLYERFTPDQFRARVEVLRGLMVGGTV